MATFSDLAEVVKLLVLKKDELTEVIRQELVRNPVLEDDAGTVERPEAVPQNPAGPQKDQPR